MEYMLGSSLLVAPVFDQDDFRVYPVSYTHLRHPQNDNAELLWHCGPFPYSLKDPASKARLVGGQERFELKKGCLLYTSQASSYVAFFVGKRGVGTIRIQPLHRV